jgi:two-component system NtrC family sensor kinase
VSSSGCGIPSDIQSRVFEPFFTTKAGGKGTGLGLAITLSIVEKHHGILTLDDAPGYALAERQID